MKLIRHNPSTHSRQLADANRWPTVLEDSIWEAFPLMPKIFDDDTNWPSGISVDISETDKEVIIEADVPGYDSKDISVDIDNDTLSIRGKIEEESEEKTDKKYFRKERRYGEFSREFSLPNYVDASKATSKLKKGTLTITLPKKAAAAKKSLKVEVE